VEPSWFRLAPASGSREWPCAAPLWAGVRQSRGQTSLITFLGILGANSGLFKETIMTDKKSHHERRRLRWKIRLLRWSFKFLVALGQIAAFCLHLWRDLVRPRKAVNWITYEQCETRTNK